MVADRPGRVVGARRTRSDLETNGSRLRRDRPFADDVSRRVVCVVAGWERLASQTSGRLEIRSLSGRLLFRKALPHLLRRGNPIIWRDRSYVLVLVSRGTATLPPISVDLARGTLATLATANDFYTGIPTGEVSPSRRFTAGFAVTTGAHWALVVRRPDGSLRATLTKPRVCPDAIEVDIQWLPDSESLVYDIRCES